MADFFNNRRSDGNFDRRDDNRGYSDNRDGGNNFDRRYSDNRGGYFDRPSSDDRSGRISRATDDRLNRQLPPIEPFGQPAPQYQPQAYQPQPQFIQGAPQAQQVVEQVPIGNVVIFSPQSFADVQTLIDHLRSHEPAVVDFAGVGDESGQRTLDFLSGAIYALGGSTKRISGTIFLFTPTGVSISAGGDIAKSIEERRNKR